MAISKLARGLLSTLAGSMAMLALMFDVRVSMVSSCASDMIETTLRPDRIIDVIHSHRVGGFDRAQQQRARLPMIASAPRAANFLV